MPRIKNSKIQISSPLLLLRQIRDVMAQAEDAQARLDQVVQIIAAGFASEVCSVYLLRAGDILELYASEGLKKSSVHLTRLGVGQGLVGSIAASAEPLNLADAESHPKFEYRPETGEEIYSSFVGVPILQRGKPIGVLVVQGKKAMEYSPDQVEVLQTKMGVRHVPDTVLIELKKMPECRDFSRTIYKNIGDKILAEREKKANAEKARE